MKVAREYQHSCRILLLVTAQDLVAVPSYSSSQGKDCKYISIVHVMRWQSTKHL